MIVVGAGPTGLMLAGELALAGVRVRVVERRDSPQRHSRALTLHPRSVEVLDQRGLADAFLVEGKPVPGWHFAGLPTRLDFAALDSRHGYTLFLAQAQTERLLTEWVRDLGVPISRGSAVTGVSQDHGGVTVAVGDTELTAKYVVGCDGGRSVVRRAARIEFPGTDETLTGMLGDFAVVDASTLSRAESGGVLAVPLGDGTTRFVVVDPQRMRESSSTPVTLHEFRTSLLRSCGTDFGVAEPRWLSRFGNATRLAMRYRAGRVLLAGDAAHIHFPAAGQGLNAGLQDAVNLGWKLAAAVHGWAPDGLLDTYHDERHPVGAAVTANTEVQTLLLELTLVGQYERPATALRALLDDLLGIDVVNRRIAGAVSALDTRYGTSAEPLIGARMPDIALSSHASVYELLHGGSFLLLTMSGVGPATGEVAGWADRVVLGTASSGSHPALAGVTEVLVRPDGHVAWLSRDDRPVVERTNALMAWAGRQTERTDGRGQI
ncbi:FAD-dependent monooxygenase [Actinoplanes sp. NPDC089786]|uniref:FAD-dependent monooxygenase n=1 Tax=Actinoplanes sp. NPDC089786 TaxID=3155185 RepID=UPI003418CFC9